MDDPLGSLQSAAIEMLDALWNDFAKEGNEGAVLAPLGRYPNAAAWLAKSMGISADCITRKLAAMLAGWIDDPKHSSILSDMLNGERVVFVEDSLSANSVGEDIMFAATRWTESQDPQVRSAGIDVLASMVRDALEDTPWNTVNWAVANLYRATKGNHAVFQRLLGITEAQLAGQKFFWNAVKALQQDDKLVLTRLATRPPGQQPVSPDDPHYSKVSNLLKAAASAEGTL